MFRRRRLPIPILVLLAALALRISDPRFVADLRLAVFDAFQRVAPRDYTAARVSVVDLDNESLDRVGQWPWPRSRVADLVNRLTDLGAQVAQLFEVEVYPTTYFVNDSGELFRKHISTLDEEQIIRIVREMSQG